MRHNIFLDIMFLENFSRLQKNDRLFRSLTGLTIDKFNLLVGKFSEEYQTSQQNRLKKSPFGRPPILESTLEKKILLPKRKITSMEELFHLIPVLKTMLIDVVERPIRRPVNNETQKLHYSGKKKRHTVKNTKEKAQR